MSEEQRSELHRGVSQKSRKIQSSYETAQITLLRMTTPIAVSANAWNSRVINCDKFCKQLSVCN